MAKVLELQLQHQWIFRIVQYPMNIQGLFSLGLTGLISIQSKGLLRVFSSTTIRKHQVFGVQSSLWSNSHLYITNGKTIALVIWTFVSKMICYNYPHLIDEETEVLKGQVMSKATQPLSDRTSFQTHAINLQRLCEPKWWGIAKRGTDCFCLCVQGLGCDFVVLPIKKWSLLFYPLSLDWLYNFLWSVTCNRRNTEPVPSLDHTYFCSHCRNFLAAKWISWR